MSNKRYYLQNSTKNYADIRLLYVSVSKYEGDWHSTNHTHYFSEIFYVLKGSGNFIVDEESFNVTTGDMVVVNPYVQHTEKSLDQSPLEYIVLGIEGLSFSFSDNFSNSYSKNNYGELNALITYYLQTMVTEMEQQKENYQILCNNLLEVLLVTISRNSDLTYFSSVTKKETKEIAVAKRYLETHYKENISLDELANICHLNKYYLVHNFKSTYGISPINYLIERRIEECKYLLQSTDYSLSQIAQIAGFSSLSYFSQSFKRIVKTSPNDYRKKMK